MRDLILYLAKPTPAPRRRAWFVRTWTINQRRYVSVGLGPRVLRLNWSLRID